MSRYFSTLSTKTGPCLWLTMTILKHSKSIPCTPESFSLSLRSQTNQITSILQNKWIHSSFWLSTLIRWIYFDAWVEISRVVNCQGHRLYYWPFRQIQHISYMLILHRRSLRAIISPTQISIAHQRLWLVPLCTTENLCSVEDTKYTQQKAQLHHVINNLDCLQV